MSHAHRLTDQVITSEAQLRALIGSPLAQTCAKITDRLNACTRTFIERSPFVCLATSDDGQHCDLSPRGDPPGFVRILDDRTLLIPERPGNRLADTLREMREDLQSSISYAGGRELRDLRKVNYVILGGENAGEHLLM